MGKHVKRSYSIAIYYLRDERRRPLVTVCLLKDMEDGATARGVAICSPSDNPEKKYGRQIAETRAFAALEKKDCDEPINRIEARCVLDAINDNPKKSSAQIINIGDVKAYLCPGVLYNPKVHFNPFLTEFEERVLASGKQIQA